jgi:myo-inositol-1(or 4)-monophosphatase
MHGKIQAREKAPADLVTEADLASQETIRELLLTAFPDHGFLGEEDVNPDETDDQGPFTWIVDPLDGTTNYVHGLDNYSVSVALRHKEEIIVGAVYDPVRDLTYSATLDRGAFCNGTPIRVSQVVSLDQALVAASLPARVEPGSTEVERFLRILFSCQAVRRLGSAALNLCYVAAGKLDGYWATSLKKWDVAAGLLLVREAGGTITSLDGGPFDLELPQLAAAGQKKLHAQLVAKLANPDSDHGN